MAETIFKTNVSNRDLADSVVLYLQKIIPDFSINFDLENRDRVLRITGNREVAGMVVQLLTTHGIDCTPMQV